MGTIGFEHEIPCAILKREAKPEVGEVKCARGGTACPVVGFIHPAKIAVPVHLINSIACVNPGVRINILVLCVLLQIHQIHGFKEVVVCFIL